MKTISITLVASLLFLIQPAASIANEDSRYGPAPGINILDTSARQVSKLLERHHPAAVTHAFHGLIHFEHATRLFVTDAIVKFPPGIKRPREVVRGPMPGGVWCDIEYREGGRKNRPAYQRAEGAVDRGAFTEHTLYIDPPAEPHCHLVVTLRLPGDAGEKGKAFVQELRKTLLAFTIDRQTGEVPSFLKRKFK